MKHYITEEQLDSLHHFKRMFDHNADEIKALCETERADISYGFQLGTIYSWLREHYSNFSDLMNKVNNQKIENDSNRKTKTRSNT